MKFIMDLSTFSSQHSGGKDEVAYNLLKGFSELGYAKNIIVVVRPGVEDIIFKIDERFCVETLNRWVNVSAWGMLVGAFTDLVYGIRLKRIVKKYDINTVLYTNKLIPCIKVCKRIILIPHDIECFVNLKELKMKNPATRVQCFILKKNFEKCDNIIAISNYDKDKMIKYLPEYSKKIRKIYDPIVFKPVRKNEKKYITALNIQWEHKNVITLIRAFARIANEITEDLILVGRKSFSTLLQRQIYEIIDQNNLQNRIIFTGFVSTEELDDIISKTRIYVNSSLFEGFGMTAVEMMGSCVPTIVNTGTALPESTMGLCRYYEPALSDENLAKVILEELHNPTSEENLKSIAFEIKKAYNYLSIAQEYIQFIERNVM